MIHRNLDKEDILKGWPAHLYLLFSISAQLACDITMVLPHDLQLV